jgi:hypothetical protein
MCESKFLNVSISSKAANQRAVEFAAPYIHKFCFKFIYGG